MSPQSWIQSGPALHLQALADVVCRTPSPDREHDGQSSEQEEKLLAHRSGVPSRSSIAVIQQLKLAGDERPRDWIMAIRYKLALYRDSINAHSESSNLVQFAS